MKIPTNVSSVDRAIRTGLSVTSAIVAYFWLWGAASLAAWTFAVVLAWTAAMGFCPAYLLFWKTETRSERWASVKIVTLSLALLAFSVWGSYASVFLTKKAFLEDFSAMNQFYKQTLFASSKGDWEGTVTNYEAFSSAYADFSEKYGKYRPFSIRWDAQFDGDLAKGEEVIDSVRSKLESKDWSWVHFGLEPFRPIFQEAFKRNGFSMLAVFLVDFHDPMERVIGAADAKNPQAVLDAYPEASEKLSAVENEAKDDDVARIREKLDAVWAHAEKWDAESLPKAASEMKAAFAKVYLSRG